MKVNDALPSQIAAYEREIGYDTLEEITKNRSISLSSDENALILVGEEFVLSGVEANSGYLSSLIQLASKIYREGCDRIRIPVSSLESGFSS